MRKVSTGYVRCRRLCGAIAVLTLALGGAAGAGASDNPESDPLVLAETAPTPPGGGLPEGPQSAHPDADLTGQTHSGLNEHDALDLVRQTFPTTLDRLAAAPLDDVGRIVGFRGPHAAVVDEAQGAATNNQLVESSLPVSVRQDGEPVPVDLSLERQSADAFGPEAGVVPLEIPEDISEGFRLGEEQIGFGVSHAESVGRRFDTGSVFYPEVATDTDAVVAPLDTGAEILFQVRSAQSPETLTVPVDNLPVGAELVDQGDGGIDIVDPGGARLIWVSPVAAEDALGHEVETSMRLENESIVIETPHVGSGAAYPILVDPVVSYIVQSYNWGSGQTTDDYNGLNHWSALQYPGSGYIMRKHCAVGAPCYGASGDGLYVYANQGLSFPTGHFAYWQWSVPHYPNSSAYLTGFTGSATYTRGASTQQSPYFVAGISGSSGWTGFTSIATNQTTSFNGSPGQGGATAPATTGKLATTGLYSGAATTLTHYRHSWLGSATLQIADPDLPSVPTVTGIEGWEKSGARSVQLASTDAGLGVKTAELRMVWFKRVAGTVTVGGTPVVSTGGGCTGGSTSPCPQSESLPLNYDTDHVGAISTYQGQTLPEGVTIVTPSAKDPVANAKDGATFFVKVDNSAPQVTLSGGLTGASPGDSSYADLTVSATDGVPVTGAPTFDAYVDSRSGVASMSLQAQSGATWTELQKESWKCPSMWGGCAEEHTFVVDDDEVPAGSSSFRVVVTDHAGNQAIVPVNKDVKPPETTITAGPTGTTSDSTPDFGFSSSEANSTFKCSVDEGAWSSCTTPKTLATLTDGPHRFRVRATDPNGNVDPTPAERKFVVDAVVDDPNGGAVKIFQKGDGGYRDESQWVDDQQIETQVFVRDDGDNIKKVSVALPSPVGTKTRTISCPSAPCGDYRGATFNYGTGPVSLNSPTAAMPQGVNPVAVSSENPGGQAGPSGQFKLRIDHDVPTAAYEYKDSGGAWHALIPGATLGPSQNAALPLAIRVTASDGSAATNAAARSGVESVGMYVDGDTPATSGSSGPETRRVFFREQRCDVPMGSCAMTETFTIKGSDLDGPVSGSHPISVVTSDGADHRAVASFTFSTINSLPQPASSTLGLEQFYAYDSTPSGLESEVDVNLATGNALWTRTPLVNQGRGLSSFQSLTYNSQQATTINSNALVDVLSGLWGFDPSGNVGGAPLLDRLTSERPSLTTNAGAGLTVSNYLSAYGDVPNLGINVIPYNQLGVGFSTGISTLTRLNEPLRVLDPTSVAFTDMDGTRHTFTQDSSGSSSQCGGTSIAPLSVPVSYDAPPGVHLRLRRYQCIPNLGQNLQLLGGLDPLHITSADAAKLLAVDKAWAITRPDGTTYFFNGLGYPTSIEDRNVRTQTSWADGSNEQRGNTIKFIYEMTHPLLGSTCTLFVPGVCEPRVTEVIDAAGNDQGPTDPNRAGRTVKVDYFTAQDLGVSPPNITDPAWLFSFNATDLFRLGKVQQVADHADRWHEFAYDSTGFLASHKESHGGSGAGMSAPARTTQFSYSAVEPSLPYLPGALEVKTLSQVTDPNGGATKIGYETNTVHGLSLNLAGFRANQVTDRANNVRQITYAEKEQTQASDSDSVTTVTDSRGVSTPGTGVATEYTLDGDDRPTKIREGSGTKPAAIAGPDISRTTTLRWDSDNNVTTMWDADGSPDERAEAYAYDENGQLTSELDAAGRRTSFGYCRHDGMFLSQWGVDNGGSFVSDPISSMSPGGKLTKYGLDLGTTGDCSNVSMGRLTTVEDPMGEKTELRYDAIGQMISETDAVGDKVEYAVHDLNGNPQEVIDPEGFDLEGGDTSLTTERNQHRWLYQYDVLGRVKRITDPRGTVASMDPQTPSTMPGYDGTTDGTSANYTTSLKYDYFDRLREESLPKCSVAAICGERKFVTRTYGYDPNDNLILSKDATLAQTDLSYTPMDQLATETQPVPAQGVARSIIRRCYDANQNLIRVISPRGASEASISDCNSGNRFMTNYSFDELGRPVEEIRERAGSEDDAITSYAYDLLDRTIGVALPVDNSDPKGAGATDADGDGRVAVSPTEAITRAGSAAYQRVSMSYDQADRLLSQVEDPNGLAVRTDYRYDLDDNLTRAMAPRGFEAGQDPADYTTLYYYDGRDDLVTTVDALGHTTRYQRDDVGRITAEVGPRASETSDPNDFTTRYVYDDNGDILCRSLPYKAGQYGPSSGFGDCQGAARQWEVRYDRNAVGNPTTITDPRGKVFTNRFFDAGQLAETTRPSWWGLDWGGSASKPGGGRRYSPVPSGAEADLAAPAGGPTIDEAGESAARGASRGSAAPGMPGPGDFGEVHPEQVPHSLPAAGKVTFDYDDEMRLRHITPAAVDGCQPAQSIAYDGVGRITTKSWPLSTGTGCSPTEITHRYGYDANGNVTSYTDGEGAVTTYAYDPFDRMTSEAAPGSGSSPTDATIENEVTDWVYSLNGTVKRRITPRFAGDNASNGRLAFDFDYDALDRLTSEENPLDQRWTYGYNDGGNLISEQSPRLKTTTMSYDPVDQMTQSTDPLGHAMSIDYDAAGNEIEIRSPGTSADPGGIRTTRTTYDGRDLPWQQTVGVGGDPSKKEVRTEVSEYDAMGNLVRTVAPRGAEGGEAETSFDLEDSDVSNPDDAAIDAATVDATVQTYDADGLLTSRYLPHNGTNADRRYRQKFAYDMRGRVTSIDSPYDLEASIPSPYAYASRVSYKYFETGWISRITDSKQVNPGSTTANTDHEVRYTYDQRGNPIQWETRGAWTTGGSPTKGQRITREFWPSGLLKKRTGAKMTDAQGTETRSYKYFYNPNRSLIEVKDKLPDTFVQGGDGLSIARDRTTVIGRDGAERESYTDEQWSGGIDSAFDYNEDGHLLERRTGGSFATSSGVNCDPRTGATCGYRGGRLARFTYDDASRETETRVWEALNSTEKIDFASRSADRLTTSAWWDSGDLRSRTKPNGTIETRTYLASGDVASRVRDPQGATGAGPDTDNYSYDLNGNRLKDERGSYVFNARDQLTKWTRDAGAPEQGSVAYQVDGSGQTLATTDHRDYVDSGKNISIDADAEYEYEGTELQKVTTEITAEADGEPFNPNHPVVKETDTYDYDDLGNTTRIVHDTDDPLAPAMSTAKPAGTPPDECGATDWNNYDRTTYHCYDQFGRMVMAVEPNERGADDSETEVFSYDGLDRRDLSKLTIKNGASTSTKKAERAYVGTSQLLAREIDYDESAERTRNDYEYDSQGLRLGQDTEKPGTQPEDGYHAYSQDVNGSVEMIEGTNGTPFTVNGKKAEYSYDPYGSLQKADPGADTTAEEQLPELAQDNPFRFQGFYYDADIESYDMMAREYLPATGRFLSQDRFEAAGLDLILQQDPLTQNRYAFAGGNPVSRIEWDGHRAQDNETNGGVNNEGVSPGNGNGGYPTGSSPSAIDLNPLSQPSIFSAPPPVPVAVSSSPSGGSASLSMTQQQAELFQQAYVRQAQGAGCSNFGGVLASGECSGEELGDIRGDLLQGGGSALATGGRGGLTTFLREAVLGVPVAGISPGFGEDLDTYLAPVEAATLVVGVGEAALAIRTCVRGGCRGALSTLRAMLGSERGGTVGAGSEAPGLSGLPRSGSAALKSTVKQDIQHAFPDIVDNYARDAARFKIPTKGPGGEVVGESELYQLRGGWQGDEGIFEWIAREGVVTHRRFIPGGRITGYPNQVPVP